MLTDNCDSLIKRGVVREHDSDGSDDFLSLLSPGPSPLLPSNGRTRPHRPRQPIVGPFLDFISAR